ncbi:patatin-like phospholipase family protein [Salinispirillum marinum]|uniref:Patatin-like phospholipase family protein n=2 Tax=Saccharospirillaceae TaxID=255527 RepID=A0ABV8BFR9_9GAMM
MPTVALALGSGGARGMAHIGVIEWLQKHDFEIVSIAGSSIGALIGGMHAAGKLQDYRDWVTSLERSSVLRMLDLSFSRSGIFKGEKVIKLLRDMTGDLNIEDLAIPFTAVATDLNRERAIWLNKGSLFDAIRSSIAVPSVFTPHHYMGRWLVDGGLVDPVPVGPTMNANADITIAVNLNHAIDEIELLGEATPIKPRKRPLKKKVEEPEEDDSRWPAFSAMLDSIRGMHKDKPEQQNSMNMVDVLFRSFDIMQSQITDARLASYRPDVVINLHRSAGGFFDYDQANELIQLGYNLTEEAIGRQLKSVQLKDKTL